MNDDPCLPREREVLNRLRGIVDGLKVEQRAAASRVGDLQDQVAALAEQPGLPVIANQLDDWSEAIHQASHVVGDPTSLDGVMGESKLNVAFVGRTEAGKSTLINALMRNGVAEVGEGEQRTTRRITSHHYTDLISIVDTPGVAAADGADDEALAAAAAHRSDFLVYVINSDQFGGEEARVLSSLDDVTSPCLLVLNVREDIDGRRKGRDAKARRRRFLSSPETVFVSRTLDEHAARIAEAAPRLWQRADRRLLPLHALAATMAAEPCFEAEASELLRNSRLEELEGKLEDAARRWIPSSRVVQVTGPFIKGACQGDLILSDLQAEVQAARGRVSAVSETTKRQVDAIVRIHQEAFRFRVGRALEPLRAEIPRIVDAETSGGLRQRWERSFESADLETEFRQSLERLAEDVGDALTSPIPVHEGLEWRPPTIDFDLRIDLTDILLDALLDGVKAAGLRGLTKAASKLLLKRSATGGASGGPVGAAISILLWAASIAWKVRLGRNQAQRRQRLELTRTLRLVLDKTESRLPQHFRRAVEGGNLGASIDRHRHELEHSIDVLDGLAVALGETRAELARLSDAWSTEQLRHLQQLWCEAPAGGSLERCRDGELRIRSDGAIPWAGLVTMEKLTGVNVSLHEAMLTSGKPDRRSCGEGARDERHRDLEHVGEQSAAATQGARGVRAPSAPGQGRAAIHR